MTIFSAIVQGIIQGLTEFLPVSSSGHLSLFQYFTGQNGESGILFILLLHLGTLLAVFIAFFPTIWRLVAEFFCMLGDILRGRFSLRNPNPDRRMIILLIISLLPMALAFLLLDFYSSLATDNSILAEGLCFLLTSLLLFASDRCVKGRKTAHDMRWGDAAAIGLIQAAAPLPGLSRSGSTIAVGLLAGLDRKFAVAFSFIMGIPTIIGANILEIGGAMQEGISLPTSVIVVGCLTSLVFGILAIKLVNWLVVSDKFRIFAWYTLVLGVLTLAAAGYETFSGHALQQMISGWML